MCLYLFMYLIFFWLIKLGVTKVAVVTLAIESSTYVSTKFGESICLVPVLFYSYNVVAKAAFDFVVMTVNIPDEVSTYWRNEGMKVVPISNSSYFFLKKQSSFYLRAIMLKVEVLTLVEYEKVVFIDYDIFFKSKWDVTSMKKMIFSPQLLVGGSSWIRTPLMASTMVMTPSMSDREKNN